MKGCIIRDVEYLVTKYNTRDPFTLCELLNINLFQHDLGKVLKGYYLYYNGFHNIVIDYHLDKTEQKVIIGHELGHVVEHSKISRAFTESRLGVDENTLEREANLFCAELLIPDEDFIQLAKLGYTFDAICEELNFDSWLVDLKIRMLNTKGYQFSCPYIATKDSIKK